MHKDELLRKLKAKADEEGISKEYPPLTRSQLDECEKELGFELPELLRRVYAEVANGGVGPGKQLLGLRGGKFADLALTYDGDSDVLTIYNNYMTSEFEWEDFDDEAGDIKWEWEPRVLPLCDWENDEITVLDCNPGPSFGIMILANLEGPVNFRHEFKSRAEGALKFPGVPLEEWLTSWIDGTEEKCLPAYWGQVEAKEPPPRAEDQLEDEDHYVYQKRKLAEAGNSSAQCDLASMYSHRNDHAKAMYWYEKAADNGNFIAMMNMASKLQSGRLIKVDWDRAYAYAKPLMEAKANVAIPTFFLDEQYSGVPYDKENCSEQYYKAWWSNALDWWEKRAGNGDAQAAYSLAIANKLGHGKSSNFEAAVKWAELAGQLGHVKSQAMLGDWYLKEGKSIEGAEGAAVELLRKAAEAGDVEAQYKLWKYYSLDDRDRRKALNYLKMAASVKAEAANAIYARSAIMDLAEIYLSTGYGEPQPDKAIKLLIRATKQKYSLASYMLAMLYKEGKLVPQDMTEAAKWFRHGLEYGGHAACTYELGLCYEKGLGVTQDTARAERYFKIAADKGFAPVS